MKMRRVFAALLAMAMVLSVLPVVGLGVTTNDVDTKGTVTGPYDNSELYLGKTAVLEDDGTYTIRLEAFATGNPVVTQLRSGLPLDIVLVLDQSGSMFANNYLETLRDSVDEFIDVIAANGRSIGVTHRVAIVGFASDIDDGSSGNADNKDYQIAGGSDNVYTNTGVFLKDGTFKNYGDAVTSYVEVEGDPVLGVTYYIRDEDRNYQKLTANVSATPVANPDTSRDDLLALVNGEYLLAMYANNAYFEVENLDLSKEYYVEIDGVMTKITANIISTAKYTRATSVSTKNGQTYYLSTDSSGNGKDYFSVTYNSTARTWTGSDGETYRTYNNVFYKGYDFDVEYYPFTKDGDDEYTWETEDGTVIDTAAQPVYDKLSGWVYYKDGAYYSYTGTLYEENGYTWSYDGTTYDPAETQFFVQETTGGLTTEDYQGALIPVTNGESGAGSVTTALDIAVSKIASSGATRTSLGMELAKNVLDNRTSLGAEDDAKRQTVVVVFTDGNPGFNGFENSEANAAMEYSAQLKASVENGGHNATVYTIGLYAEEAASSAISVFMHGLSSNFPTATKMSDVATITYSSQTINFKNEGLTTEPKVFENYVYRESAGSSSTENYNYLPLRGYVNEAGSRLTLEYLKGSEWTAWKTNTSTFNQSVYVRSVTDYDTSGKHYMYASNKEVLYDIFPEIVTDSTTTTLDEKYLSTSTILRDILQKGFVFTNGTTVTMSSLTGTWNNEKKITWADSETVIDSVTVTDATAATITSEGGKITLYNQGGSMSVEATGFDFNANYFSQGGHENGAKLVVTISRVEATDQVVWNQTELTNDPYSGVWSPNPDDNNNLVQIGVFPQPNTIFTNTVVVMDYAKTTEDLAALIRQSGVKHLDNDGMNYFSSAVTNITDGYGYASISNGKLTYTPNSMKWDGYDSFYVFGDTSDAEILRHSANKVNGNVWSKVTVMPANNVYYEDTFIEVGTEGERDWGDVVVGIEFSGDWSTAEPGDNTDTPETDGDVHGWEESLADDTGYSDGTVAVGGANATATFTFAGTGVDIYSRTNMQTGLIMASLFAGDKAEGVPLRTLVVDNFAHSGDYYMIPTLSINQLMARGENGAPIKDADGNYTYVPMEYGTYTVKLMVIAKTDDADLDGTETTRSTYYLDGIRVYNPVAVDGNVKDAYGDEELNAVFTEVRDILLDAGDFGEEGSIEGSVFIDQIISEDEEGNVTEGDVPGTTLDIGVYQDLGPENEVYLAQNQMIAFAPNEGGRYFVGLKSPTGADVTVQIYKDGYAEFITINHTTDLFYEVTPEAGIVVISNMSGADNLLAITKIKVTGPDPEMTTFKMFRAVSRAEVLAAANEAYTAAVEPETETPDIIIENPAPEAKPDVPDALKALVARIFDGLWHWFH